MAKAIIVSSARLTRELLRDGEKIIDIKPNKALKNATVFVFEGSENIKNKLEERRKEQSK